jgi:hypothetical protein
MVVTTNEWQVVQVMQQSRWSRLLLLVMLDSENTHIPDWDKSREARPSCPSVASALQYSSCNLVSRLVVVVMCQQGSKSWQGI